MYMKFKIKKVCFSLLMIIGLCFSFELQVGNASEVLNIPSSSLVFSNQVENVPEKLLNRIAEYWEFKANLEFKSAYALEAPHTRYQLDLEKYLMMNKKARKLNSVLLLNVDEFYDMVEVRLKTEFDGGVEKSPNNNFKIVTERWIKLDDSWYHVFSNTLLNMF